MENIDPAKDHQLPKDSFSLSFYNENLLKGIMIFIIDGTITMV